MKWVCRASEPDLSGTKSVTKIISVTIMNLVMGSCSTNRSLCYLKWRFHERSCSAYVANAVHVDLKKYEMFPSEFFLPHDLMHVSNLALIRTKLQFVDHLQQHNSDQNHNNYCHMQLSVSFCSINWSPRWICWSFKSDLSSTTRYHQRDISNICKFGNTKARAKHNLLFNKMASEVVLIITIGSVEFLVVFKTFLKLRLLVNWIQGDKSFLLIFSWHQAWQ